jgi:MFS family permease
MATVAIVLYALAAYGSPFIAGLVTFASFAPGIIVSPLAGALLDRHRRSLLVRLDYALAGLTFGLLASLAALGSMPPELLLAIVAVSALTTPLSSSGLGSLFPLIVPEALWERANATDSNTWVVASILGPPAAAFGFQIAGGPFALAIVAGFYLAAAVAVLRIPEPVTRSPTSAGLLRSAWHGLLFTIRSATLRGLGISVASLNVAAGVLVIVLPVILVDRLHAGEGAVGLAWGAMGLAGVVSAIIVGRLDSRDRERWWLAGGMVGTAAAIATLLAPLNVITVLLAMAGVGLFNGLLDVALFTVRQRRTPRAWMGRAFAVSMAINSTGYPIGSALSGPLVSTSLDAALVTAVAACLVGAAAGIVLIPATKREAMPAP